MELPLTHPELYEDIGIKPPKVLRCAALGTRRYAMLGTLRCAVLHGQGEGGAVRQCHRRARRLPGGTRHCEVCDLKPCSLALLSLLPGRA